MIYGDKRVDDIKIAYIGGGSRLWAWGLMSDLAVADDISGRVDLYDIDYEAALANETIGNKYNDLSEAKGKWVYTARKTLAEALTGADFVIVSILPGTFDEMESDVHHPEKYGIYQPVGDSTGPGGILRALRMVPMYQVIARGIREHCPRAYVINYTNPMTLCTAALYREFPEIRAFGCCHEVFGTKAHLINLLKKHRGITATRAEIQTNVVGVNHFTWFTSATYRGEDLFPFYAEAIEAHAKELADGLERGDPEYTELKPWGDQLIKHDLFKRYGLIAAAGDRHLSEFCEGSWYLESPEMLTGKWRTNLTTVQSRRDGLAMKNAQSKRIIAGEETVKIRETGEEGVLQIRALLGLGDLVTNVNLPNVGQIPNLPMGAVLESNAAFTAGGIRPLMAGPVPTQILNLIGRISAEQQMVLEAAFERDLDKAFAAFCNDPLVRIPLVDARRMFDEMVENTKAYLTEYLK